MVISVADPEQKKRITADILSALPEWFGIPESTQEYIDNNAELPFWAEELDGSPIGFIALRETGKRTAEIYVMGVRPEYHRGGVGQRLFSVLYDYCKEHGYAFLQVKTVDAGCYAEYDRTRLFYEHMGFTKFEVFPELWDKQNPCLVMVMNVK